MATTLTNLLLDIRARLVETTADFFSDAELTRLINFAYRRFARETEWTERHRSYPFVANQFKYALPSDTIKVIMVRTNEKERVWPRDLEEFTAETGSNQSAGATPDIYVEYPQGVTLQVYPRPSATSDATTVSGSHNSTVTTIAVTSATDLPDRGVVLLNDSEQVRYYAKSGNSLTQCIRGDGGTTAASYSGTETVKLCELDVYSVYQPADLSAGSDSTAIPTIYDEVLIQYTVGTALLKRDKYREAKFYIELAEEGFKKARAERDKATRDRHFVIKDDEVVG